jgi:hypothetical protein
MPNGQEAEERIRLAEAHALEVAEAHGLEAAEQSIARELFPNLDIMQRALLVAWKLRVDPVDEDELTEIMKDSKIRGAHMDQMRASGLFNGLTPLEQAILQIRYGIEIPAGWA